MSAVQSEARPVRANELPPLPEESGDLTIEVNGVFDGASAWELRNTLDAAKQKSGRIVLDFSRVREFYDFGVSILAHALAQRPSYLPRVALRGLRTHQLRMLRYFGVDVDQ